MHREQVLWRRPTGVRVVARAAHVAIVGGDRRWRRAGECAPCAEQNDMQLNCVFVESLVTTRLAITRGAMS